MSCPDERKQPNILITGTPGVGKTEMATLIAEKLDFHHINVGNVIKENKCHLEYDETLNTHILDEEKLLDILEIEFDTEHINGGIVADYHACELFPERWFDLILVLRADTEILYDRLTSRGYSDKKRNENMQCEIMNVILDEAKESYDPAIVQELSNNTIEEMDENVSRVEAWYHQWLKDHHNT
jgi:adenylate kinase